jgi:riboflavin transporter FmnP
MFDAIILAAYFLMLFIVSKLKQSGKLKKTISTRKIAFLGIMVGLASALMLLEFPVIPGYHFLKIELSALMIFMTLLWFDFKTAVLVSVATNLIHVFMPTTPPVILFMDEGVNFIATMIFIAPTAIFMKKQDLGDQGKRSLMIWLTIASALLTSVVMVMYNQFVNLPIIYKIEMPFITVLEVFGVFNLIKWGLNALVINLLWRRLYSLRMIGEEGTE